MQTKLVKIHIFFFFAILSGTNCFAQSRLSGRVVDDKKNPVSGADVYLDNTLDGGTTDSAGYFKFTTNEKGSCTLIVTEIGYDRMIMPLTINGSLKDLLVSLKKASNLLQQVVITAGSFDVANENKTVLKPMDIMTTAGASADVVKAIETLPGMQQPGAATGLFVRGGDASETAILMDGAVVQNAFFSSLPGVSQSSRFSPFQFKGISFSSGAYSARYGQALSSVLELNTIDADDKSRISAGANITGVYTSGDKAWKNSSLGFSGYYNNLSPFYGLAKSNVDFFNPPIGSGASARYVYKPNKNGILKIAANIADYKAGLVTPDPFVAGDSTNFNLHNTTLYTNISYKQQIQDKWSLYTIASYSHNRDNVEWSDAELGNIPLADKDYRLQYRVEATRYVNNWFSILEGAELQHYGYSKLFDIENGRFTENLLAEYTEVNLSPVKWLAIRPGLRYEYSGLLRQGEEEPRLSLAVKTTEHTQVSLATGTFYEDPDIRYLISGYKPAMQEATHYIANFQWMQSNRTLRLEGYYKDYKSLVREYATTYDPNDYRFIAPGTKIDNSGYGYAKGAELFWRDKKSVTDLDYWISYSYTDTKRLYEDYLSEATPNFVSKNNLNVVSKYFVEKWQTNFSLTYTYASGRPYYNPGSSRFLGDETPAYNNLALSIGHLTRVKSWFTVIYLGIDNLTNQHNIFGYRYSIDGLNKYPILPALYRTFIIGFIFHLASSVKMNYKFLNNMNMKKIITLSVVCFFVVINCINSNPLKKPFSAVGFAACTFQDFKAVLQQTFNDFDGTTDQRQKIALSNRLSMIAARWNNEWLAHYYLAYSKVVLSEDKSLDGDKRDAYLDEADKELNDAVSLLGKDNDETYVLAAFIANWRIDISPMMRYMKYGNIFSDDMKQAKAVNPDNPRIYYLEGMAFYSMPKFAGGGKDVALPYLTKAAALYDKETDADIAKPYWGKKKCAYYLKQCKS